MNNDCELNDFHCIFSDVYSLIQASGAWGATARWRHWVTWMFHVTKLRVKGELSALYSIWWNLFLFQNRYNLTVCGGVTAPRNTTHNSIQYTILDSWYFQQKCKKIEFQIIDLFQKHFITHWQDSLLYWTICWMKMNKNWEGLSLKNKSQF